MIFHRESLIGSLSRPQSHVNSSRLSFSRSDHILNNVLKNNLTILAILCAVCFAEPTIKAEVIHPARVYPATGPSRNGFAPKKKHWWQRKETPQSRAKERANQRAKMQKKRQKARTSKISYDPMWNDPVATSQR